MIEVQETVFNTISVRQSAHAERSGGRISCRVGEERERAREQFCTRRVFRQSEDLWSPRSRRFRCSFNLVLGPRSATVGQAGRARCH